MENDKISDEHFITEINIEKVRHLKNINISLSKEKRNHLIFTGKNGSGKTSVLNAIKSYLKCIENNNYNSLNNDYPRSLEYSKQRINSLLNDSSIELNSKNSEIDSLRNNIKLWENELYRYGNGLKVKLNSYLDLNSKYQQGKFILAFFDAKRISNVSIPQSVPKVELQDNFNMESKPGNGFLQYLVYLKTQQAFARNENDMNTVENIEKWFINFENALRDIFNDGSLKLIFDYKSLNFKIEQQGREPFGFDVLSEGYSSVLDIIMDIILRMEKNRGEIYDIEGIVMIDEVETHLHIELQKKIMPFLTSFFPKIQFIITTHSPFVLSSINNAVVYDLENRIKVEDLSKYAYDAIVENYFDVDKYSNEIKGKMARYEELVYKKDKNSADDDEIFQLRSYLKDIPESLAPELIYKFRDIELNRKLKLS